jgi:pyrroloquinoline quinone biosynthesis protein B
VTIALIDGTFWSYEEISSNGNQRDFNNIPHPPISQTLELLGEKRPEDPDIFFIHLNHTNPVIDNPIYRSKVESLGWQIGEQGMIWSI